MKEIARYMQETTGGSISRFTVVGDRTNVVYMDNDQCGVCHYCLLIGDASLCIAKITITGHNMNWVNFSLLMKRRFILTSYSVRIHIWGEKVTCNLLSDIIERDHIAGDGVLVSICESNFRLEAIRWESSAIAHKTWKVVCIKLSKPYLHDGAFPTNFHTFPYIISTIERERASSERQKRYAENLMRAIQLSEEAKKNLMMLELSLL
ncbi:hypothetical protein CDAR_1941 [Caerostris darwini]|uniref:Uncharacterized protein n=1 Tax=Caerostris darwini TaxID=1538125 RepID=A0AAV4R674_9ARAC|nr:hypothetical protein CDAR_1941 [Caerostris darwini]